MLGENLQTKKTTPKSSSEINAQSANTELSKKIVKSQETPEPSIENHKDRFPETFNKTFLNQYPVDFELEEIPKSPFDENVDDESNKFYEIDCDENSFDDSECLRKNKNSLIFGISSGEESADEMTPADKAAIDDSMQTDDFNYRKFRNQVQLEDDNALIESLKHCLPALQKKKNQPPRKRRKLQ